MTSQIGVVCENLRCSAEETDEPSSLDVDYIEESLRELFIPRSCLRMGNTIGRGMCSWINIALFSLS